MKNNLWKMTDKQIIIVKRIQQCGGHYTPYGAKEHIQSIINKAKECIQTE